ncbi:uncharacterized protein LOC119975151 isoform X2 [Scyliorhinus canicula]|nr:uncharacterized protein LOC119975151 isoform X2 [Scyliorhinus canicula]
MYVLGITITLALIQPTVSAGVAGDSPVPVSGFVGEQVVLPCIFKGNITISDLLVVWRISEREILLKFINGSNDLTEQDAHFRNRTTLFKDKLEQGNWSVLISDLRESDQHQFACQISDRTGVRFHQHVNLSVTGRGLSTGARAGLGIGIPVSVVAGIVVFIILKRQSRKRNRHQINQNEASNGVSLTEVTCSGEARGLVTTAPEHQDGAAREQNLLRSGIVQIPLN